MIRVICPGCGKPLTANSRNAGMKGRCPTCGAVFQIPESGDIPTECPGCGKSKLVDGSLDGKKVRCTDCGTIFAIAANEDNRPDSAAPAPRKRAGRSVPFPSSTTRNCKRAFKASIQFLTASFNKRKKPIAVAVPSACLMLLVLLAVLPYILGFRQTEKGIAPPEKQTAFQKAEGKKDHVPKQAVKSILTLEAVREETPPAAPRPTEPPHVEPADSPEPPPAPPPADIPIHATSEGLFEAIERANADMVKAMLNTCPSLIKARNEDGDTLLIAAVRLGCDNLIDLLISKGASVLDRDTCGLTPLHRAAINGRADMAGVLIAAGAPVRGSTARDTRTGATPLHYAAGGRHGNTTNLLLKNGADVNAKDSLDRSPLHYASARNRPVTARVLIEHGACLDATDKTGRTPLQYATAGGFTRMARLLTDNGAGAEVRDCIGLAPLHYAAKGSGDHADVAQILLLGGANVDSKDSEGRTPLILAALNGNANVAKVLIENGADIDATDGDRSTPLHLAARKGHIKTVQLLLDNGARINARDRRNNTPLTVAEWNRNRKIIDLLRRHR